MLLIQVLPNKKGPIYLSFKFDFIQFKIKNIPNALVIAFIQLEGKLTAIKSCECIHVKI